MYKCSMPLKRYKEILRHLRFDEITTRGDDEHIDVEIMDRILETYSREDAVEEYLSRIEGIDTFRGILRLDENGMEQDETG